MCIYLLRQIFISSAKITLYSWWSPHTIIMGKKDFCCAEGCSHERSKGATCGFYNIPMDHKLRKLWLTKISRVTKVDRNGKTVTKPWEPSKSSKLCGCHFENPPPPKSRKKWFTVPNIFSHRTPKPATTRLAPERKSLQTTNHNIPPVEPVIVYWCLFSLITFFIVLWFKPKFIKKI